MEGTANEKKILQLWFRGMNDIADENRKYTEEKITTGSKPKVQPR